MMKNIVLSSLLGFSIFVVVSAHGIPPPRLCPEARRSMAINKIATNDDRVSFEELMRSWNDPRYGKVELTCKQWVWWFSLEKLEDQDVRQPQRKKRDLDVQSAFPVCTRKEYRMLTSFEQSNLHTAFNAMVNSIVDPDNDPDTSEYDLFVMMHRKVESPGAHGGPAFLPWHREFLLRMEQALRNHVPNVCLPYWDSSLDQPLPKAAHSALWTSPYLGNNDGLVTSGFASGWLPIPDCEGDGTSLYRNALTGHNAADKLFSLGAINFLMTKTSYDGMSDSLEVYHGSVHTFVDGHMGNISCSPTDPVFWMHHAFVDCIWERFRRLHPYPGAQPPELDYSTAPSILSHHELDDPMLPFPGLLVAHGLGNHYTNIYYGCAHSPDCFLGTCTSPLLWCDGCLCKAKVKQGGACKGLPHEACAGPCPGPVLAEPYCNPATNKCDCTVIITDG